MYFLIIVAAIAVYVIMTRNKFNELQQMIKNGVSDIGVQSEVLENIPRLPESRKCWIRTSPQPVSW